MTTRQKDRKSIKEWPASVKIWQIQIVDKSKPPKNDKSGRELAADWDPPFSIIPLSCFDATNNDSRRPSQWYYRMWDVPNGHIEWWLKIESKACPWVWAFNVHHVQTFGPEKPPPREVVIRKRNGLTSTANNLLHWSTSKFRKEQFVFASSLSPKGQLLDWPQIDHDRATLASGL